MCAVKIKLTSQAIGILTSVLPPSAMGVIYLMGMGMTMPDDVTKHDLIKVISVLCKKMDWIEEEKEMNKSSKTGSNYPEMNMKLTHEAIEILSCGRS